MKERVNKEMQRKERVNKEMQMKERVIIWILMVRRDLMVSIQGDDIKSRPPKPRPIFTYLILQVFFKPQFTQK